MKRLFTCCAILALAVAAEAADESLTRLSQLLDARLGENPKQFAESIRYVVEDAKSGLVFPRFALTLVARDANVPEDVRSELTDELLERYRSENHSAIELAAKNKGNALAWYLLSLDTTNAADRVGCLRKAASFNNVQALNELGVCRMNEAQQNLRAAYDELRQVQERGGSAEEVQAARNKVQGQKNRLRNAQRESVGYFNKAAEKNVNGVYNLGMCLFYGYGCPRNEARAFEMLKAAAKDGQAQALCLLGECLRDGIACPPDPVAAATLFKQSAESGHVRGLFNYGLALLEGLGVDRDEREAMVCLRKAADSRLPEAMNRYARCLMDGVGFFPIDTTGMLGSTLEEAQAKNAAALAERQHLAVAYWYHCANVCHLAAAMEQLGNCFFEGKGVEKRPSAAVYWYYRAAMDYDHTASMFRLADCCDQGIGGLTKSHDDANWWRTRAKAVEGDRLARIWLVNHDPHRFDRLVLAPVAGEQKE